MNLDFSPVLADWGMLMSGAAVTIEVTAASLVLGCAIGLLVGIGRLNPRRRVIYGLCSAYLVFFRGTPLLVQVLIIYLALPQFGIVLGALSSGIIALSMNYGAYLAETIRSGVLSVPRGQQEAALALGVSRWTVAVHVTAPQALRIIIPPAGSMFISMLKDSSLVSLMGLWELNFLAQSYGRSTYRYMEMLATAAAIYWIMSIVLELLQSRLERRFAQGHRR